VTHGIREIRVVKACMRAAASVEAASAGAVAFGADVNGPMRTKPITIELARGGDQPALHLANISAHELHLVAAILDYLTPAVGGVKDRSGFEEAVPERSLTHEHRDDLGDPARGRFGRSGFAVLSFGEDQGSHSAPDPVPSVPSPLELLTFERTAPAHVAMKARAVRKRFGFSLTRYHQLLSRTIRSSEGRAADPETAAVVLARIERHARMPVERRSPT